MSEPEYTLVADGRARDTAVELNESTTSDRYELEINRPELYLRFQVASPSVIRDLAMYLQYPSGPELAIGSLGGEPLTVVHDDQYPNVYILRVLHDDGAMLWTLRPDATKELLQALERAIRFLPH